MAVNTEGLARPEARSTPEQAATRLAVARWQLRLLPFMGGILGVLTVFFYSATLYQLYDLQRRIGEAPTLDVAQALAAPSDDGTAPALAVVRWRTLATLEAHAIQRRYHQANALLMARIWLQYLGFVTGMTLALVGATFILGKLRESTSRLEAETGGGKLSVQSASPGLVLAILGTALMLATMLTHNDIDVHDVPLYVSVEGPSPSSAISPESKPDGWKVADPGKEAAQRFKKPGPETDGAKAK